MFITTSFPQIHSSFVLHMLLTLLLIIIFDKHQNHFLNEETFAN